MFLLERPRDDGGEEAARKAPCGRGPGPLPDYSHSPRGHGLERLSKLFPSHVVGAGTPFRPLSTPCEAPGSPARVHTGAPHTEGERTLRLLPPPPAPPLREGPRSPTAGLLPTPSPTPQETRPARKQALT